MKDLVGKGKPFYSALDLGAKALKRKVGTGSEFLKELMALPGVKPTELKERNLEGLMNAPRMTHEEFLTHLAAKPAPAIREKILNNPTADDVEEAVRKKLEKTEAEELKSQGYSKKEIEQELEGYANNIKRNRPTIWDQIWRNTYSDLNQNPTAHDQYTLPGGERYREMLIKAPKGGDEFPGVHAHFGGEPGILASMRLKDRLVPDLEGQHNVKVIGGGGFTNVKHPTREAAEKFADVKRQGGFRTEITPTQFKKLLHLEELQSDWHQQGRDKGYIDPNAEQKLQQIEKLKSAFEELQTRRRQLHEQAKQEPDAGPRFDSLMEEANSITPKLLELNSQMHNLEHFGRQQKDAVPDAPFKKNWEEMALKRLMHHAAEKGYHGLVVTPGDVQADRYSLAKHVGMVAYHPEEQRFQAFKPNRETVMNERGVTPERISELIGKEAAERLLKAPKVGDHHFLEGEQLQMGGEGMKAFYDKKVPNILNAIGKKYGIKTHLHDQPLHDIPELPEEHEPEDVESHRKMAATRLHHFPITEPMRQDILKNGLPLYKEGGMIHKAQGGTVQPSINQMRMALMQNKFVVPSSDLKTIGAQEAPQLDTKLYINEGGQDGMGGVDMNAMQPGMQLMQAQPNLDPTKNQPQGGQPSSAGASSPLQQQPSNILQMTRQGQAMNAMTPPQQAQGMKDGGEVGHYASKGKVKQTVKNAQRIAYPGIYGNPKEIAALAASRVAPEDPLLNQIFGVTRADMYQQAHGRQGMPHLGMLPGAAANPKGSMATEGVMNKRNEQRLLDVMSEAQKHEGLRHGMEPWYYMNPLFNQMVKLLGLQKATEEYKKMNALMGMASSASEVNAEIPRGSLAYWLQNQGRFNEFVKHAGKRSPERPADFGEVPGHIVHKTAQAIPMQKFLERGEVDMSSPKVPMYIEASGVPATGFQTRTPVGDAHWSRAVGLADTRNSQFKKGEEVIPSKSVTTPEMSALGPWWRHKIASQLGLESVPAQALAWGAFAPQTGVTTPIGAPKLELIAKQIGLTAQRLGVSPQTARDLVLTGKERMGKKKGGKVKDNLDTMRLALTKNSKKKAK